MQQEENAHESYTITRSSKETDIWPHSEEISRNQSADNKQSFYYSLIYRYFSIDI